MHAWLQASNLTVLRVFGTGADKTFPLTIQPGTAGADGKTWPNGARHSEPLVSLLSKVQQISSDAY